MSSSPAEAPAHSREVESAPASTDRLTGGSTRVGSREREGGGGGGGERGGGGGQLEAIILGGFRGYHDYQGNMIRWYLEGTKATVTQVAVNIFHLPLSSK